jgi:xanthine dehydrogenase YagR molybdenum-binding subunit
VSTATGEPLSRVDGIAKVTGAATYAAEFARPDLAHGVIIQSTIAKGRITEIDSSAAERAPGVLAVITHRNAPELPYQKQHPTPPVDPEVGVQLPMLHDALIRHNGQHIGVVIAETFEQATYAADLVRVAYAEEPAATSVEASLPHASPVTEATRAAAPRPPTGAASPTGRSRRRRSRSTRPTSSRARTTTRSSSTPRSPSGTATG